MKIAVTGTRGFPGIQGGIEYHCEQLYTRLAERGCDVTVFVRKPYVTHNMDLYKGVSLTAIDCPRSKFLEADIHAFRSVLSAKKIKPDIMHFHTTVSYIFAPLAKLFGMNVVVTLHCQGYKHAKWGLLAKLFIRLTEIIGMKVADGVIAVSQPIASAMERLYHRKAVFIPNGVQIPALADTEDALSKFGITKNRYILSVGRFTPEKGFEDLIEAFNTGDFEGWKLVIVGSADHETSYSRNINEMARNNPNIILTGFLSGVPLQEIYTHAGLFVLPSHYEGLPIVLLEAMSYGLSCIASDIEGSRNVGLSNDRYFKTGDVKTLTAKINGYINKQFTQEERERQIRSITEKYDWDKITDMTMEVYKQVMVKDK